MRALWSKLAGARQLEWIALVALLAVLALALAGGGLGAEASTELERRLERVLSAVDGAGRVRVMALEPEEGGGVAGIVVVARGAGELRVRLELTRAVCTLTGVDAERVEVLPMDEGG